MNDQQERAAFEAWAREHSPSLRLAHSVNVADLYNSPITNIAWGAWQAGRAALAAQQVAAAPQAPAVQQVPSDHAPSLARKLLDVACRMRAGETQWRDDEMVDAAAHELIRLTMLAAAPQAPAVPETTAQKGERNARVQARYDELMQAGKHGHYETLFRVVREEVERAQRGLPQWQKPAERLVRWLHCMSYNESYFGEPAGYLKQCVNELRHLLPPHELKAAAPGAAQPAPQAPLTDEQWKTRIGDRQLFTVLEAIRFVEKVYGIAAGVKEPT